MAWAEVVNIGLGVLQCVAQIIVAPASVVHHIGKGVVETLGG